MEIKDFFLAPIYLILIYTLASYFKKRYWGRNSFNQYFMPALSLKIFGAIMAGMVYQFYYEGGDTFWFFQGATIIWDAFIHDPITAFKIFTLDALEYTYDTYEYTSRIWWFRDEKSMFVIKIAGFLSFFCFNSYVVVACLFACISFSTSWMFYLLLLKKYPYLEKLLAYAIFFIPSVFFWGSGLFKDTLTISSVMLFVSSFYYIFIKQEQLFKYGVLLAISIYVIIHIRSFYLLALTPCCIIWLFITFKDRIKSPFARVIITPIILGLAGLLILIGLRQLSNSNTEFSDAAISQKIKDFHFWHGYLGEQGGSGYTLGEIDYSLVGMAKKFPVAVNVALFRPYIWEVKNPIMLLAALESLAFLIFTLYIVLKTRFVRFPALIFSNAEISFCFLFGVLFAFIVGFTSFNFGALVRYKIPFMPFYSIALVLMWVKMQIFIKEEEIKVEK